MQQALHGVEVFRMSVTNPVGFGRQEGYHEMYPRGRCASEPPAGRCRTTRPSTAPAPVRSGTVTFFPCPSGGARAAGPDGTAPRRSDRQTQGIRLSDNEERTSDNARKQTHHIAGAGRPGRRVDGPGAGQRGPGVQVRRRLHGGHRLRLARAESQRV
ncbi:MAG: hypothetical protein GX591_06480 [Planctomycetes bacterium]|nr:hypothetical protein [Planctomycetota bacterium]